ncbi:metallophosphoesterase [Gluconobacter sp. OJB]|uniref:metallophosphoesterase n=1 Tax=Gluconobacter sp. OJB TaxID=3145196 RepID=UPI0031F99EA0
MTRLWVLSDLHLEAVPFPDGYDPVRPEFDVLVAAGDLWRGEPEKAVATLNRLAGGRPAVFVAGNHEAWGMTPDQAQGRLKRATAGTTVHLLGSGLIL